MWPVGKKTKITNRLGVCRPMYRRNHCSLRQKPAGAVSPPLSVQERAFMMMSLYLEERNIHQLTGNMQSGDYNSIIVIVAEWFPSTCFISHWYSLTTEKERWAFTQTCRCSQLSGWRRPVFLQQWITLTVSETELYHGWQWCADRPPTGQSPIYLRSGNRPGNDGISDLSRGCSTAVSMLSDTYLRAMVLHMHTVGVDGQDVETGLFASVLLRFSFFCGPQRSESLLSGGDRFSVPAGTSNFCSCPWSEKQEHSTWLWWIRFGSGEWHMTYSPSLLVHPGPQFMGAMSEKISLSGSTHCGCSVP